MGRKAKAKVKCFQRVTVTLPAVTVDNLSYVAERMALSRSALMGEILGEPAADLRVLVDSVPGADASEEEIRRARGASAELIRRRIREAMEEVQGLDS